MSAPVGGDEWNVGRTEWNVHAICQHPSETKSLTLGGQFSSSFCRRRVECIKLSCRRGSTPLTKDSPAAGYVTQTGEWANVQICFQIKRRPAIQEVISPESSSSTLISTCRQLRTNEETCSIFFHVLGALLIFAIFFLCS